jgi:adenosine deaminase/adenosine deaminase CECR1
MAMQLKKGMSMKLAVVSFMLFSQLLMAQNAQIYLEKNRTNEAALTAFFMQMPKGGDLHHHYGGAIYAEPLLERAINEDFYLNTETFGVSRQKGNVGNWERFSELQKKGLLPQLKQQIIQKWSIKDYNGIDYPSDKLFFETFDKFWPAAADNYREGMLELKNRAIKENVSYIETQFGLIPHRLDVSKVQYQTQALQKAVAKHDEKAVYAILDTVFSVIEQQNPAQYALDYNENFVKKLHNELEIDDSLFTMRYQNFVLRFFQPVDLFANLVVAFISANESPLIAGVNIVAPEDGETALKDYELHMMMFNYCHKRYPKVKYALHAGELTIGSVMPEDLSFHIRSAVMTANANRIGHGIDIGYETNSYQTLKTMAKRKIPVEINLSSNEFILKVKDNRHPILLYKQFGVPMVICTDDAGILRTNLTEQYVLLAKRYPTISYSDIKQFVFNSIEYSFIQDENVKKRLMIDLKTRFEQFENNFTK